MSTQLSQIAKRAKLDRKVRFTSLAHLLTPEFLKETWGKMNRRAAGGVDGESAEQFERELGTQIEVICAQLKAGTYRAPPVRRVEIPKGPGKVGTSPLGIPTAADRLLQRAVARIVEAVFEADFLECSYGFRPGRNPHHALQALRVQIVRKKVMQVFEADIRSYFTRINRQWLRKMVAHRIADPVILSLIGKWLNAGAMQDGVVIHTEEGTPQGGPITPLTQKITSSLSGEFRAGASSRWLICDAKSIIVMSHGAIHAGAEGATSERSISTSGTSHEPCRGSRGVVERGSDLTASCIPLSRGSRATRATGCHCRAHTAHHLQDLRQCHRRVARVCRRPRSDIERGRDMRHHRTSEARTPACVSGTARVKLLSNTLSIVCSPPSSSRFTSYSFPIVCAARAKL